MGSLGRVPGECPNFVKLGDKWLLIASHQEPDGLLPDGTQIREVHPHPEGRLPYTPFGVLRGWQVIEIILDKRTCCVLM